MEKKRGQGETNVKHLKPRSWKNWLTEEGVMGRLQGVGASHGQEQEIKGTPTSPFLKLKPTLTLTRKAEGDSNLISELGGNRSPCLFLETPPGAAGERFLVFSPDDTAGRNWTPL